MAVSQVYRSNPIRMMGMASGMDTQSIIDATLRMHQFKIDRQMKNRTLIEWKQKYHNDIKNQITSLKNTYLSNLGSKTMMNRNVFNTNLATATTASGAASSAVSVNATVNAGLGSMTINSITQIAKGSSITSSAAASADKDGFTVGQTLEGLEFAGGKINFENYKANAVTTSGKAVTLSESDLNNLDWKEQSSFTIGDKEVVVTRNGSGLSFTVNGEPGSVTEDNGIYTLNVGGQNIDFSINDEDKVTWIVENGSEDTRQTMAFEYRATIDKGADGQVVLAKSSLDIDDERGSAIFNNNNRLNFVGETDITINGKTVALRSNMSLGEMLNKINSEVSDVTISYNRMQDRFVIENKAKGNYALDVEDNDRGGNIASLLFGSATVDLGQKAIVTIEGETMTLDDNYFSYRGINLTFKEATSEAITINVTRDTDKAVDAIKDFIDGYNTLIAKLEGMLNERKSSNERSYEPLTDEEKAGMTEKQIEEWEAIAKKGIMRDDRTIQNLVSSLRASFFEQIEGTGLSASQLGLTTGSYFDGTGGQIIVNEDRLRAALETDPDRVADVFVRIDYSSGTSKGVGLMHKINDILTDYTRIQGAQDNTLKALEKSYNEMNARIAKLEERMWAEEDKLYRQFAAMETAMSKLQQQGDWFSSMLGGM